MRIKLLFNYKNLNQKLNQIKFIKELFGLGLKEAKDTVQLTVYSHLQNLFPQECILLNKKEYEKERKELMKYKSLYLDLIGSIRSVIDSFPKE